MFCEVRGVRNHMEFKAWWLGWVVGVRSGNVVKNVHASQAPIRVEMSGISFISGGRWGCDVGVIRSQLIPAPENTAAVDSNIIGGV